MLGATFKLSEVFSFPVATIDQSETDRYWNAIVGNGEQENERGWCRDERGSSWQITPMVLIHAFANSDRAIAQRGFDAMVTMKKIDIAAIEAAILG